MRLRERENLYIIYIKLKVKVIFVSPLPTYFNLLSQLNPVLIRRHTELCITAGKLVLG